MRGMGLSFDPSTYDLGTHRPADQLAQALEGYPVGPAEPPASSGLPHNVYPIELVRRARNGLGLADPPGGSPAPATPTGLPGTWIDDTHYKDALGNLWIVNVTSAWSATSAAYGDTPASSHRQPLLAGSRSDLQFRIDEYVAERNPHGVDAAALTTALRVSFAIGAVAATLTIGAITGAVLLFRHARRPRSNPRRRTNPRRRRRRR